MLSNNTDKAIWDLESRQGSNTVPGQWGCTGALSLTMSPELSFKLCSTWGKSEPKPSQFALAGAERSPRLAIFSIPSEICIFVGKNAHTSTFAVTQRWRASNRCVIEAQTARVGKTAGTPEIRCT